MLRVMRFDGGEDCSSRLRSASQDPCRDDIFCGDIYLSPFERSGEFRSVRSTRVDRGRLLSRSRETRRSPPGSQGCRQDPQRRLHAERDTSGALDTLSTPLPLRAIYDFAPESQLLRLPLGCPCLVCPCKPASKELGVCPVGRARLHRNSAPRRSRGEVIEVIVLCR